MARGEGDKVTRGEGEKVRRGEGEKGTREEGEKGRRREGEKVSGVPQSNVITVRKRESKDDSVGKRRQGT